jgi:outer membrane protein assembly factor BamB
MNGVVEKYARYLPTVVGIIAAFVFGLWVGTSKRPALKMREPGQDRPPGAEIAAATANPFQSIQLVKGNGIPSKYPGEWTMFRGGGRDNIVKPDKKLATTWQQGMPKKLWEIEVGEGYAGPAVKNGMIYLMDYDRENKKDALRCLSLDDGKEIWRLTYPVSIKRNHGITRTVPAVTDKYVIAMGPKCHVVCADAQTGEFKWGIDLVKEYGTTVPQWYAGQCPLVETNRLILAPGGKDALLMAVDCDSGKVIWKTPNPNDWKMTHSSVVPMIFNGKRMYVYCSSGGVVGVSASDGSILWEFPEWKITIANIPSPLPIGEDKIFLTGGYGAGSAMIQLKEENGKITVHKLYKLTPEIFGAAQHTPVFYKNHIFGIRADGQFVCITTEGKPVWASTPKNQFGLGPFLLAGDYFYALSESGKLSLISADPSAFNLLAQAQVLDAHEAWGPMALVGTRLLVRDFTRLACLDVGED